MGSKGKDFAASMREHYHASDHSKTNGPGRNRHEQTTDDVAAADADSAADFHPQAYQDPAAAAAIAAVAAKAGPSVHTVQKALDTDRGTAVEAETEATEDAD